MSLSIQLFEAFICKKHYKEYKNTNFIKQRMYFITCGVKDVWPKTMYYNYLFFKYTYLYN